MSVHTTYAAVAGRVRRSKEAYPERYCADPRCLWRLSSGPCPKHSARPAPDLNVYGQSAAMVKHTPAEADARCDKLWHVAAACDYCNEIILERRHATAMHRQRDDRWLLLHDVGQGGCTINAIMEANALRDEARRTDTRHVAGV